MEDIRVVDIHLREGNQQVGILVEDIQQVDIPAEDILDEGMPREEGKHREGSVHGVRSVQQHIQQEMTSDPCLCLCHCYCYDDLHHPFCVNARFNYKKLQIRGSEQRKIQVSDKIVVADRDKNFLLNMYYNTHIEKNWISRQVVPSSTSHFKVYIVKIPTISITYRASIRTQSIYFALTEGKLSCPFSFSLNRR